jgi:hypothetical protein
MAGELLASSGAHRSKAMRACDLLAVSAAIALSTVAACESSPAQPTPQPSPSCSFQLAPSASSFGFEGGTASIAVSTGTTCTWSASSSSAWITIQSGANGTGPGTVALTVAANAEAAAREGTVLVAGQSVRLAQQGRAACDYAISPDAARFDAGGGTGSVAVTTAAHCAWTATTSDAWITVAPSAGTGSGVVNYTVAGWPGSDDERTGTIRVAGAVATIRQSRDPRTCAYTVSPTEFLLHWHHEGGDIHVTTDAECTWTVTDSADWLSTPGAESRTGSGIAQFTTSMYLVDGSRRAPVEIRWPTASQGQNVWVTQEGCRYGVSSRNVSIGASGGSATITVVTQPVTAACNSGCPWTAVPSASWIRITSGSPGSGDNPFRFEVGANTGGARSGTIRVGSETITVSQAGV